MKISFVCFLLLPSMASSLSTDSLAHPTKIMCYLFIWCQNSLVFFSLVFVDEDFAIFSVFAENGCKSRCFFFLTFDMYFFTDNDRHLLTKGSRE